MENKLFTSDVVREISDKLQYFNKDVREVLDCFAFLVGEHVQQGETVYYAKLGTFHPRRSRSKKQAGALAIKFRAAKALLSRKGVGSK